MTGHLTPIARPYAVAAFEYAVTHNEMAAWENMLNQAAFIVQQKEMDAIIENPSVTATELAHFFNEVLAKVLNNAQKNFIHLLANNKRLKIIPAILDLFKHYREEREHRVTVQVTSAIPLEDQFKQVLEKKLTKKLNQQVSLQCEVDPSLLGGAILRIMGEDKVIDGSVRGKLNRLLESL